MNGDLPATAHSEEEEDGAVVSATMHNVNCSKARGGGPRAGKPSSLRSKPDGETRHNASQGLVKSYDIVIWDADQNQRKNIIKECSHVTCANILAFSYHFIQQFMPATLHRHIAY